MIGRYFGDKGISNCGKCDVCSEKKQQAFTKDIPERILNLLRRGPSSLDDLSLHLNIPETALHQAIQFLQSENKLTLDKDNRLALK
jgi:predicted transcriptional regulator